MFQLVQLADGKFRLTVDYDDGFVKIHQEWYFDLSERSDAEEAKKIFVMTVNR